MKTKRRERTCPLCGKKYTDAPALSREDNLTLICPDCGYRQAMQTINIHPVEQEEILRIMHRYSGTHEEEN